jgi:hypothetical protein
MHFKAAEAIGIKSIWTKRPIGDWFVEEIKQLEKQ